MSSRKQENHTGTYNPLHHPLSQTTNSGKDKLRNQILYQLVICIFGIDEPRYVEAAFSPVLLSTLENGKIVKGLSGIPSEGPVLFVGYHMLLGLELSPLVLRIFSERGILVRGMAHPIMFKKFKKGGLLDTSHFDTYRTMGAVPVSPTNLFKLFKLKSHILLYPGGAREALHRKVRWWICVM